ncbi:hypothetical protein [Parasulfitobacter algicola]|uniref:Uncharacterized protein n=1 Tax=Parasulfitobacter algicola TaxID=2614809 RepID=A0ABX2IQW3_9RHOB|nr:hypothetical protein [Sulfitobacter algicola]NSX54401.1 hypothetical protein [Sulfitobacter algicola]
MTVLIRLLLSLTFSLCTLQSALARCVTSEDLQSGIAVTHETGPVEIYRMESPDIIQVSSRMPVDNTSLHIFLSHGMYEVSRYSVQEEQFDFSSRSFSNFQAPSINLPVPTAETTWSSPIIQGFTSSVQSDADADPQGHELIYQFGQLTTLTLVDCTYLVMPVSVKSVSDAGAEKHVQLMYYFPDIGIRLIVGDRLNGEPANTRALISIQPLD